MVYKKTKKNGGGSHTARQTLTDWKGWEEKGKHEPDSVDHRGYFKMPWEFGH